MNSSTYQQRNCADCFQLNSQLQLCLPRPHHEATLLNLSIEKASRILAWKSKWNFEEAISKTVSWYEGVHAGIVSPLEITRQQIAEYQGLQSPWLSLNGMDTKIEREEDRL